MRKIEMVQKGMIKFYFGSYGYNSIKTIGTGYDDITDLIQGTIEQKGLDNLGLAKYTYEEVLENNDNNDDWITEIAINGGEYYIEPINSVQEYTLNLGYTTELERINENHYRKYTNYKMNSFKLENNKIKLKNRAKITDKNIMDIL